METEKHNLPLEWEERWRREKERRRKVIEESEEGLERANQELKWIVASNDSRTGLRSRVVKPGTSSGEAAEHFSKESLENEDRVCIYSSGSYPKDIFQVLKGFWRSSLLTDLTLVANSNKTFQVHSVVLAAVSTFIQDFIKKQSSNHSNDHMRTLSLGPDVHHIGLQAVVDFAYTGSICLPTSDSRVLVKATARALGAPRLLEVCDKDEKGMGRRTPGNGEENEEMKITLESIKNLWSEGVGCDVVLEVDGALFHGEFLNFI